MPRERKLDDLPPAALKAFLDTAMAEARYEVLGDGRVAGEIPSCIGVMAVSATKNECEADLRSVLEGWVLLGLELGHRLPTVGGIDLNQRSLVHVASAS